LEKEGHDIALVVLSGVQYYTGQFFKIKEITEAAHKQVFLFESNIERD
jgi:kynureninase